jgi:3-deoxy-7-phosphoheptulonate synthase
VHHDPDRALSDGMQSVFPEQFDELMAEIRSIAPVVHRSVQEPLSQPVVAKAGK